MTLRARALALLVALTLTACGGGDDERLLTVNKTRIPLAIHTTGELQSARTVELGPPTVKYTFQQTLSFLVPEGTWVEKGQKVMAFDAQQQYSRLRDLQNRLATERQRLQSQKLDNEQEREQLALDLAEARMQLKKAELKASSVDGLMARLEVEKLKIERQIARLNQRMAEYRQQNRIEQMRVNREIIRAEVERLTAEVNDQRRAIASMQIKAPRAGLVVYIPDNDGNKPAEGDQFSLIQKIVEIPDLDSLVIETTIEEQNAHKVAVGDRVEIKLDALPGRTFGGEVTSLGRIVRLKSRREPSKVFDARVAIDTPDTDVMRPGMAARLSIVQRVEPAAVAIPQSAIVYREDQAYVRLKALAGEREQRVTIVARQNGQAIVTQGLEDGDEVIL